MLELQEVIRAHQKIQDDNSKVYENFEKEVYLTYEFEMDKSLINIEGRADGIIIQEDRTIIEEIKSTYQKLCIYR